MDTVCLTHQFLIAMPGMTDPNFSGTLTYICEHNPDGALGIIVNKPLEMRLATLFDRVGVPLDDDMAKARYNELPVFFGGPVQTDRGFVLHRPHGKWQSSLRVNDELALTSSRDILVALAADAEAYDIHVTLGYAGWTAGQLEWELSQNAWLTVDADASIIFDLDPAERFPAAMQRLGVNPMYLSEVAGHA